MATQQNTYNGWKNYETWNVMLHIGNDYYLATYRFNEDEKAQITSYRKFIEYFDLEDKLTMDGIHWLDSGLDYASLDEAIVEMVLNHSEGQA